MNAQRMLEFKYFKKSLLFGMIGVILAFLIGYLFLGSIAGGIKTLLISIILSILEVSLSFDNAIVNASILKKMTPIWQHRFLTWGIIIATFGMRLIFPLILVGLIAKTNPLDALVLAFSKPDDYAKLMLSAHTSIAAYGGSFLLMVALNYFFQSNKEVYWIKIIERPLSSLGRLDTAQIGLTLIFLYFFSQLQMENEKMVFLASGLWGTITYIAVDGISNFLETPDKKEALIDINKASMGMFVYLEVLDASFSFDGVVGAFAITNNLFIIMIGLGVGAMFVRSFTIMLVEKGAVQEYRYLEHGAFYAIGVLALIMFGGTIKHMPELITGLIGILIIGLSLISSIRYNRKMHEN